MSRIIIVKLERLGEHELMIYNRDHRYQQRSPITTEIMQILKQKSSVFAEARLQANGQMVVVRRARDRSW